MRRSISISILVCVIAVTSVIFYDRGRKMPEETQVTEFAEGYDTEPVVDVAADNATVFLYLAKDCDGRIVIYRAQTMELYMETGIRTKSLPQELTGRLADGIGFVDEAGLFDFLESYSS